MKKVMMRIKFILQNIRNEFSYVKKILFLNATKVQHKFCELTSSSVSQNEISFNKFSMVPVPLV